MVAKAPLQVYVNRNSGHLMELNASFFLKSIMCGKPKNKTTIIGFINNNKKKKLSQDIMHCLYLVY